MKPKLDWVKHGAGGVVAIIPPEFGGSSRTDGYRQSSVHIIPRAFGSTKARMRISNHVLQPWNFQHQFYDNVGAAKRALTMKLEETFPQ